MNEEEWIVSENLYRMVDVLGPKASSRKLRLFGSACCRRFTTHFKDARSLQLVDVSERFADRLVDLDAVNAAFDEAADAQEAIHWEGGDAVDQSTAESVLGLREALVLSQVFEGTMEATASIFAAAAWERIHNPPDRDWSETHAEHEAAEDEGRRSELIAQVSLLRDIFGNPFRPVAVDPEWLTSTVVALARGIYDDRAFDRLPILADALQDAGYENEDVLNHCRGPGPHVRGCWVVDLLLGKD